jgi:hypothetical protein
MKRVSIGTGVAVLANDAEQKLFEYIKKNGSVTEKEFDNEQLIVVKRLRAKSMIVSFKKDSNAVTYSARRGVKIL